MIRSSSNSNDSTLVALKNTVEPKGLVTTERLEPCQEAGQS